MPYGDPNVQHRTFSGAGVSRILGCDGGEDLAGNNLWFATN
jgi:hypothetical protein